MEKKSIEELSRIAEAKNIAASTAASEAKAAWEALYRVVPDYMGPGVRQKRDNAQRAQNILDGKADSVFGDE